MKKLLNRKNFSYVKRLIFYSLAAVVGWFIYNYWYNKPYCNIEIIDQNTVWGQQEFFPYLVSKFLPQRRERIGNSPYKMYVVIHDKGGIRKYEITVNGVPIPIQFGNGFTFDDEVEGSTNFGINHYHLKVWNKKGYTSESHAYVEVKAFAG